MAKRRPLAGSSLRVYLALLKAGRPLGVREVQRMVGFKSPSTAMYHLNKLVDLGYAVKAGDGYEACTRLDEGVLGLFERVGSLMVPRVLFYALFFTFSLLAFLLARAWLSVNEQLSFYYAVFASALASALMWLEAVRLWRRGLKV